jgi:nucleoside-diphosphate-sugar epimerase
MSITLTVPRLGWSMEEGAFVAWLKRDGETVHAGDPLFSIEGDKAVQEVESLDSGILRIAPHGPKPGDPIRVGDVLGHLLSTDEANVPSMPSPHASPLAAPASTPPVPSNVARHGAARTSDEPDAPTAALETPARREPAGPPGTRPGPSSRVARGRTISPRAWRVAAELGIDWTTVIGTGRTGRIRERDIRAAAGPRSIPRLTTSPGRAGPTPVFLVTGGAGFIGTWVLRELLGGGARVVALDTGARPGRWERILGSSGRDVPLVQGSLLDRDLLAATFAEHAFTHVIHLAAWLTPACQLDPWEGCRINVLGTLALLEQLRATGARLRGFSYASSVAVFGDEPDQATPENSRDGARRPENQPLTFYGAFKKSIEMLADQYWRHYGIASVGLRPQVVYGPERDVGLTAGPSLAARAAARGDSFCIGYTGRVGYDYVEDVARAFVRSALETPPGAQVVDLPGGMMDVQEIIAAIGAAVPESTGRVTAHGPPIPTHAPPRPNFITSLFPDWVSTPLAEGIERTIEFYRARVEPLSR